MSGDHKGPNSKQHQDLPVSNPSAKKSRRKQSEQELDEFYKDTSSNGRENMASRSIPLGSFYDYIGRIANLFDVYQGDIHDLGKKHAKDLEREEKIKKLEVTVEILQQQSQERTRQLEKENSELKRQKVENEQIRKGLEQRQAELDKWAANNESEFQARVAEKEKRLQEDLERMKHDLNQKNADRMIILEKEKSMLQKKKEELNGKLQKMSSVRKDEQRQWQRESKMHHDRMSQLEGDLQRLEAEFTIESKPVEFYRERFGKVCDAIQQLAQKFFGQSIEYPLIPKSVDAVQKISSILRMVPIPWKAGSQFLQVMAVRNAISCHLVQTVWQPFYTEQLISLSGSPESLRASLRLFRDISGQLITRSGRIEAMWRSHTYWALDHLPHDKSEPESACLVERLTTELHDLLSPLIRRSDELDFLKELGSLIRQAIELWKIAQKDGCRISVVWPDLSCQDREGWVAESDRELEDVEVPEDALALAMEKSTCHCTFPRIVSQEASDGRSKVIELYGGRVLWADSKAVAFGLRAYHGLQEEWAEVESQQEMKMASAAARRLSTTISGSPAIFRRSDYN